MMGNSSDFAARVREAQRRLDEEEDKMVRHIAAEDGPLLEFISDLLATIRVLLDTYCVRIPDDLCGVVTMSLYAKIFGTCRSVYQLCRSGGSLDAPSLTRSAVEALITLRFITRQDCGARAERWVKYSEVAKWKALRKLPHLAESDDVREAVRKRAESVAHLYPNDRFWASGLGVSDLRRMAEIVNLLWHYDAVYWMGSQPTHATAIGLDEYFLVTHEKKPVYKMGLSGANVHSELAAACDALIRGLMFIEEAFNVGMREALVELRSRYGNVLGPEANMGETA